MRAESTRPVAPSLAPCSILQAARDASTTVRNAAYSPDGYKIEHGASKAAYSPDGYVPDLGGARNSATPAAAAPGTYEDADDITNDVSVSPHPPPAPHTPGGFPSLARRPCCFSQPPASGLPPSVGVAFYSTAW